MNMSVLSMFWDEFIQGFMQYAKDGFSSVEPLTYPFIFVGIFGWIYSATQSAITTIIGIIITLIIFGGVSIFNEVPQLSLFLYIITIIGFATLFSTMLLKQWRSIQ